MPPWRALVVAAGLLSVALAPVSATETEWHLLPGGVTGPGTAAPVNKTVRVALLDTGIRDTHVTFGSSQVVAWYDFGRTGRPASVTDAWDPVVDPYDDNGHGTAVASMVGGLNTTDQTPSHAPGVELAIAKISDSAGGAAWDDVRDAVLWARDVAEADVISLSFYGYLPQVAIPDHTLLAALETVRKDGLLPVVLAGNGLNNMGLPTMSWLHPPATSRYSLVVGGATSSSVPIAPEGSMDAEVTARYSVRIACHASDTCWANWSGTSFSTPLVAGMAATVIEEARAANVSVDADRVELLLKRCAKDTSYPPILEGYGFLNATGLDCAVDHAVAQTEPANNTLNWLWVDAGVQDFARAAWGAPGSL